MIIAGNSTNRISTLKAQLAGEFDMKNLGVVNHILGMKVLKERKSRKIWLSQKGCGKDSAMLQHAECKTSEYSISYSLKVVFRKFI